MCGLERSLYVVPVCRLQQEEEAAAASKQGVEEQKQFEALQARYGFTDKVGRASCCGEVHGRNSAWCRTAVN